LDAFLRPVASEDLETLRSWRNHPSVRSMMFNNHEVSMEEHQHWYSIVSYDPQRRLCLFMLNEKPSGFVQFVMETNQAEWSFHLAPLVQGKGHGLLFGRTALKYAFEELQVDSLIGNVRADNQPSLQFHRRLGFSEVSQQKRQGILVYCFCMTLAQWCESVMGGPL